MKQKTIFSLLSLTLLSITLALGNTTPKTGKNNAKTPKETVSFYPSTQKEGFIGASEEKPFDSPSDNVFEVVLKETPDKEDVVWLTYELYGVQDHTAVSRSINDQLSVGGYLVSQQPAWSKQEERISTAWLKKGSNIIRFTLPEGAPYHYQIRNLGFLVEKQQESPKREIVINQPGSQLYFNDTGYLKGFIAGKDSEKARLYIDGKEIRSLHSEFEALIKNTAGQARWQSNIKAIFPDGQVIEKEVIYTQKEQPNYQNAMMLHPGAFTQNLFVPGAPFELQLKGAAITIDATALKAKKAISITALRPIDIPAMDMGMVNVTKGSGGFRFLPHGTQFTKEARITLEYDPDKIPEGYSEKDIKTYYFDESKRHWVALQRDTLMGASHTLISKTTHFTDMINGIIKVPESPETSGFTPTSIKDIKAANPSAGINTIEPPSANAMGSATMGYPIVIPAGRQGMQPQLGIQYNSEGGNDWLGLGWNLQIPSISIDTRWGVPRYDTAKETETYSMGGEQLYPVAHRGTLQDRSAEKQFYPRVEGSFNRIIRHGDNPGNYWWEVTDKSGVRYFYGGRPGEGMDNNAVLTDGTGNIAHWALTEVRDLNSNFVRYHYTVVEDTGLQGGTVPGYQIYVSEITYTGEGNTEGPYRVIFTRDRELAESRRPDVSINARYGFKQVTADLLRRIEVQFDGRAIRSYELTYTQGAFYKTLLERITEYDASGSEFNTHEFEYYDDVRRDGAYRPFTAGETWTPQDDDVHGDFINPIDGFNDDASALSGSKSNSESIGTAVTYGFNDWKLNNKSNTVGGKFSQSTSASEGMLALVDINGDGLPDKVMADNNGMFYRANQSGPGGTTVFGDSIFIMGASQFSKSRTTTRNRGFEAHPGGGFLGYDKVSSTTFETTYFSDINGDGLIDIVANGIAYYNHVNDNGDPVFTTSSTDTPSVIDQSGTIDQDIIEIDPQEQEALIDQYPLHDVVKMWKAPFDGTVSIKGGVSLKAGMALKGEDGVRVAIQHGGMELWSTVIAAGDHNLKIPSGVDNIVVSAGDRLYFRVQSIENGANDQVLWSPAITYTDRPLHLTNANGHNVYRYPADQGFILTANQTIEAPIDGVIKIEGVFDKPVTSDNLTAVITHDGIAIWEQTYSWDQLANEVIDIDVNVGAGDIFNFRITTDTNIDWNALSFTPRMYYTVSNDPAYPEVIDGEGQPLIEFYPAVDYSLYPAHLLEGPETRWEATVDGSISIQPQLTLSGGVGGEMIFSVKKDHELVAKDTVTVVDLGLFSAVLASPVELTVAQGDVLYLEYHAPGDESKENRRELAEAITVAEAVISSPALMDPIVRNVALHTIEDTNIFGPLYRHWGQFAYNGNRERADQPINEADLELDEDIEDPDNIDDFEDQDDLEGAYDPLTSNFIVMAPIIKDGLWRGYDDLTYVTATEISSSRMGLDDVSGGGAIPGGAGVRAVNRVTKSTNNSFAGGAGPASLSTGSGSTETQTEFMDINGDRYPDIVTQTHIQYTLPTGSLEEQAREFDHQVHRSTSSAQGINLGGSHIYSKSSNTVSAQERTSATAYTKAINKGNPVRVDDAARTASSSISVNGSYSDSKDATEYSWMDVNGDGLPDKVFEGGNVSLNLGYSFADQEEWGYTQIRNGESIDWGAGLGVNIGNWSIAAGISLSKNENEANMALQDMNGDGLVDIVISKPEGAQLRNNPIQVRFNTGSGFTSPVDWTGSEAISQGVSTGESVNVAFTVCVPLTFPAFVFKLCFNPSITTGQGASRERSRITDIDGDGYPDVLSSEKDNEITVKRSTIGRTNMLKGVKRPLGAEFSLEYARLGNTYELPHSKWVLSEVAVHDGVSGDGADVMKNTFEYEDGYYDRHEREFYGFGTVRSHQLDTENSDAPYRSVVQEFHNDNYYRKGLPERETLQDAAGNLYTESLNTYELKDIETGNLLSQEQEVSDFGAAFPALSQTVKQFYEGQGVPEKSTIMAYSYDLLGNMTGYTDFGESDPSDDINTTISYHSVEPAYIMGVPQSVVVSSGGQTYRQRETSIDPATGQITQIRKYLENGTVAEYDMAYDPYGNLSTLTRPENEAGEQLSFTYTYDDRVHTYVTGVSDSYGYNSSATYDYRFGQVLSTTGMNKQQMHYTIDDVGRIATITGPFELAEGAAYTIAFEYHPEADIPWALTRHYDPAHPGNDLETVTFIDGLKRALQVKKDGAIHTGPQSADYEVMIVSGQTVFDAFGRTTESYYPVTEPKGSEGVFNTNYDNIAPTTTTYDVLDRALSVTLPDGAVTTTGYGFDSDRDGDTQFSTLVTDANGIWKQSFTNVRGLTTAVKEQYSQGSDIWTSYTYNPLNELTHVTDDQSNVISSQYDWLGRRTQVEHPDAGLTTYTYDLASNLTQKVTANLQVGGSGIAYLYDHERLTEIHYPQNPQNNVTYTYGNAEADHNRAGRIVLQEDATGSQEFFYNPLGAVIKTTRIINVPESEPLEYTTEWSYDTWNRVTQMIYPDSETLTYTYNVGGLLHSMSGVKSGTDYNYLTRLGYDKFEQRVYLSYGNGTETFYTYEPDRRRLQNMIAETATDREMMNNVYTYDHVNNITRVQNMAEIPSSDLMGGSFDYHYEYDDLYRLTDAEGLHSGSNHEDRYTLQMAYNSVHSIVSKNQVHEFKGYEEESWNPRNETTYNWSYEYGESQPHAPVHIGERSFTYDANGNQTGWEHDVSGQDREIIWDEENRIRSVSDNGALYSYIYDAGGERVLKNHGQGQTIAIDGEESEESGAIGNYTIYVNPYVVVRSGQFTKHFYIESQRIVSKLGDSGNNGNGGGSGSNQENFQYYYHPDHLGSSSYISDVDGEVAQHVEYFPFGETFLEEHSNTDRTPYLFNGKELDEETQLYYYGARYYDPRTSVWQSVDTMWEKYAGTSPYIYVLNNPITYIDPDGRELILSFASASAKNSYTNLVNSSLGGKYKVNLVAIKGTSSYKIEIVVSNNKANSTSKQKAFYKQLNKVVSSKKVVNQEVVENDSNTTVDSWLTAKIDIEDVKEFDNAGSGAASSAGALIHSHVEQLEKSKKGLKAGDIGAMKVDKFGNTIYEDYQKAHKKAIQAENKVNNNKRGVNGNESIFKERNGTKTLQIITPKASGGINIQKKKIK